jgi:hypothetical protein
LAFYLLATSFVLSTAAACADSTGPRPVVCDKSNGNVCQ